MTDTNETETETVTEKVSSPFTRFSGLLPLDRLKDLKVAVVGAGGIGAPVCLALAKMGVHHIEVWDPDVVALENIGTQMYGRHSIDNFKVSALRALIREQADWCKVTAHKDLYTRETRTDAEVVIVALDSLRARKDVWSTIDPETCKLFIDPRMGAEALTVHSITPSEDHDWYPLTLEGKAVAAPCTEKSTFHCGFIAGALAAREVKAYAVGERTLVEYTLDLRFMNLLGMDQATRKENKDALLHSAAE